MWQWADSATGRAARRRAPEAHARLTLPPRFASRLELICRADNDTSAQLLVGARVLLARLVAWAGARQARIARFTLVMPHEPRRHPGHHPGRVEEPPPDRSPLLIAPAEPAADAEHLYSLLVERLGRLPLAAPALELSLHSRLFHRPGRQRRAGVGVPPPAAGGCQRHRLVPAGAVCLKIRSRTMAAAPWLKRPQKRPQKAIPKSGLKSGLRRSAP